MRKTFVSGLITLGAGTAALGTYILVYRPWEQHWGATDTEVARPMAGDDLVDGSLEVTTRAVTVNAAPEYIWPWLMQMGNNRGGLYSYDWLDIKFGQLDRPSVDRVLPEFQHLKEGDVMPYARTGGMLVKVLEPNRAMLLVWQGPGYQVTQSWGLYARDRQHTRLVILSLVGFSSSGLLSRMSFGLGVLLFGNRGPRWPGFRHEVAQDQSIPADQQANNGDDASRKTTEHAWTRTLCRFATSHMGLWQCLQTAHGQIRIDLSTHAHHP
jgi:hypothetical protein